MWNYICLLWSICYEYYMLILSCVRWHVHKSHIAFFTFICDLLHYSDQLCKSTFHWGWWNIVSLDPTMAPIGRSFFSMFMSPSNSIIPSFPSRCSSSSSSLDYISSGICHGFVNMWPNPPQCDPYHVPR